MSPNSVVFFSIDWMEEAAGNEEGGSDKDKLAA